MRRKGQFMCTECLGRAFKTKSKEKGLYTCRKCGNTAAQHQIIIRKEVK